MRGLNLAARFLTSHPARLARFPHLAPTPNLAPNHAPFPHVTPLFQRSLRGLRVSGFVFSPTRSTPTTPHHRPAQARPPGVTVRNSAIPSARPKEVCLVPAVSLRPLPHQESWLANPRNLSSRPLYRAADVAKMLQCSEWWIKEQARNRRIPFSWIGGSYRFTDEHVEEVIRLFEQRPESSRTLPGGATQLSTVRKRQLPQGDDVGLRARTPRRALKSMRIAS